MFEVVCDSVNKPLRAAFCLFALLSSLHSFSLCLFLSVAYLLHVLVATLCHKHFVSICVPPRDSAISSCVRGCCCCWGGGGGGIRAISNAYSVCSHIYFGNNGDKATRTVTGLHISALVHTE